ncbi:MAG: hypothetical protein HRU09_11195 [Oligoflexales bacterium]|nr:hypothetical protein [Oligoflexales bacterium]
MKLVVKTKSPLVLSILFILLSYWAWAKLLAHENSLSAPCTTLLLHLSFLLEGRATEVSSAPHSQKFRNQALVRASISRRAITHNREFLTFLSKHLTFQQTLPKENQAINLSQTFVEPKHAKMWKELKRQAEKSTSSCQLKKDKNVLGIIQALLGNNHKTALKLLLPELSRNPSTQLLFEWVQRLYARAQRSPGRVTLEHLK